MRLDKYLAKALNVSRKVCHDYIKNGDIEVNHKRVLNKELKIEESSDIISYLGHELTYHEFYYYMLNKPKGYLTACSDQNRKVVMELFSKDLKDKLFPIGRLDKDTEGLLLLTNNGSLCHKLTSPLENVEKRYYTEVAKEIEEIDIEKFENGLTIKNGKGAFFITKPAKLEKLASRKAIVTISEGKYHQIKEMFKKINNEVIYLKRLQVGPIILDESLKLGEYRALSKEEEKQLIEFINPVK